MPRELVKAVVGNIECVSDLSEEEEALLNEIKPQHQGFKEGSVIFREGEPSNHFLLVKAGICYNHRHLEDGRRQIIDLFFPGEVVALGELSCVVHASGLTAYSDCDLLAYDKAVVKDRLSGSPTLSRLFIELISKEQVNLTNRLVGAARHSARQRVAHFLVEVQYRYRRGEAHTSPPMAQAAGAETRPAPKCVPLVGIPQILIADALGLSVVHVNRVFRQFRDEGLIRRDGQGGELADLEGLKIAAGWLPSGSEAELIL